MKLWPLQFCILALVAAAFVAFAALTSPSAKVRTDCAKAWDTAMRGICQEMGVK